MTASLLYVVKMADSGLADGRTRQMNKHPFPKHWLNYNRELSELFNKRRCWFSIARWAVGGFGFPQFVLCLSLSITQTTTGMVAAALVAWTANGSRYIGHVGDDDDFGHLDAVDGVSEEQALLKGTVTCRCHHSLTLQFTQESIKQSSKSSACCQKADWPND